MSSLATIRTRLRPWRVDEADRLLDIRSRPEVARWLGNPDPWTDVEQALDRIREWDATTATSDPLGVWAIVPRDGVPVGTVSLFTLPRATEVEIGWHLHPEATGNGWAREAAAAVLAHGLAAGVARIWAIMWADNHASARVAEAIGMADLGVRDDPWYGTAQAPRSRMFRADAPSVPVDPTNR